MVKGLPPYPTGGCASAVALTHVAACESCLHASLAGPGTYGMLSCIVVSIVLQCVTNWALCALLLVWLGLRRQDDEPLRTKARELGNASLDCLRGHGRLVVPSRMIGKRRCAQSRRLMQRLACKPVPRMVCSWCMGILRNSLHMILVMLEGCLEIARRSVHTHYYMAAESQACVCCAFILYVLHVCATLIRFLKNKMPSRRRVWCPFRLHFGCSLASLDYLTCTAYAHMVINLTVPLISRVWPDSVPPENAIAWMPSGKHETHVVRCLGWLQKLASAARACGRRCWSQAMRLLRRQQGALFNKLPLSPRLLLAVFMC